MRLALLCAFSAVAVAACRIAHVPPDPTSSVRAMLDSSAAGWNARDLDKFVAAYADDSMTTFVSGGHLHQGIAWIREHYQPSFGAGGVHDSLRFTELRVRPLGDEYALGFARYELFRGDSVTSSGPFTLIVRRTSTGWRIVHDHTSEDR